MRGRGGKAPARRGGSGGAPPGFSSHPSPNPSSSPATSSSSSSSASRVDPALFRATKSLQPSLSTSSSLSSSTPSTFISPTHLTTYPLAFLAFLPDPSNPSSTSLLLRYAASDLSALLALPSLPFLSHLHLNASLHTLLTTFLHHLRNSPPPSSSPPPPELLTCTRLTFLALHRLASSSPSQLSSLPPHFPSLPLLLDFCTLYAPTNPDATSHTLARLLSSHPTLLPSLTPLIDAFTPSLTSLATLLSLPVPLPLLTSAIAWLSDCYRTWLAWVQTVPASMGCAVLGGRVGWMAVTARLYGRVTDMIGEGRGGVEDMRELRRVMMSLLHRCIDQCYVQPLLRESGDAKSTAAAFVAWLDDTAATAPALLAHYAQMHGLAQSITSMATLPALKPHLPANLASRLPTPPPPLSAIPAPTPSLLRSTSTAQREREEEEAVHSVCEMLEGEVSEDFARAVLREYDGDVGRAVDGMFSGTLPPRLEAIKRDRRKDWKDPTAAGAGDVSAEGDGDMLAGDDDGDAFQQYLLRTGRVLKADSEALSRSSLSVFEDRSEREMLKERIIASAALDAAYDDDYDDSYNDFLSFKVDETAIDIEDERGAAAGRGGRPARAKVEESGGVQQDVREKWRKEEADRERRKEEEAMKRIEQIAPSKRSDEEKREWERLTHKLAPHTHTSEQSTRGARGFARGKLVGRGGMGRGEAPFVSPSQAPAPAAIEGAAQGSRGRGRGRGAMIAMSSEEREAQRLRKYEQSQTERQNARGRIYSDEDDDDEEEGEEKDAPDGKAEAQLGQLPTSSQEPREGDEGGGGRGRGGRGGGGGGGRGGRGGGGRGWGVGPRGSRGGRGRGGHHNQKALATRKMNSTMRPG